MKAGLQKLRRRDSSRVGSILTRGQMLGTRRAGKVMTSLPASRTALSRVIWRCDGAFTPSVDDFPQLADVDHSRTAKSVYISSNLAHNHSTQSFIQRRKICLYFRHRREVATCSTVRLGSARARACTGFRLRNATIWCGCTYCTYALSCHICIAAFIRGNKLVWSACALWTWTQQASLLHEEDEDVIHDEYDVLPCLISTVSFSFSLLSSCEMWYDKSIIFSCRTR